MNIHEEFIARKIKFKAFFDELTRTHAELSAQKQDNKGHGFDHDLMVAQYGVLVSETPQNKDMVWIAGLLHSFDRLFDNMAEEKIDQLLAYTSDIFTDEEIVCIKEAVDGHSGSNFETDSLVKIALQDADRLANTGAAMLLRIGQFRSTIPICEIEYLDSKNPTSTYSEPKSLLDDIRNCLEWETDPRFILRLPLSQEISKRHFRYAKDFIEELKFKFEEVGLYENI